MCVQLLEHFKLYSKTEAANVIWHLLILMVVHSYNQYVLHYILYFYNIQY